jgi:hypothetical protein
MKLRVLLTTLGTLVATTNAAPPVFVTNNAGVKASARLPPSRQTSNACPSLM